MAREASLWALVRDELGPYGDLVRVENRVEPGTPDVNYAFHGGRGEGWLELKDADAWPVRGGVLRMEHVTEVQRRWWLRRAGAGGQIWVLVRVARTYMLFRGEVAARQLGRAERDELASAATVLGEGAFPKLLILQALTNGLKNN